MKKLAEIANLFDCTSYQPGEIPDALLEECIGFRTKIYIEEGYLPEPEQAVGPDCYDAQSAHICVRAKKSGHLAGYCRMIHDQPRPLPISQLYPGLATALVARVEISRFSVRHLWRGKLNAMGMAPIFCLARELLVLSRQQGILHWACLIDERFRKLCARFFKIDFHILGDAEVYMGSPSVPSIVKLSESIQNNMHNPAYTEFWGTQDLQDWVKELKANEG